MLFCWQRVKAQAARKAELEAREKMEEAQRVERERALRECEAKAAEQVAAGGTGVKAPVERGMRSLWCVVAHEGPPEVGKLLTCMWRLLHRQRNMASRQGPNGWDHHKKVVQDHQPRAARTVCLAAPSYAQATRALRAHATLPVWLAGVVRRFDKRRRALHRPDVPTEWLFHGSRTATDKIIENGSVQCAGAMRKGVCSA